MWVGGREREGKNGYELELLIGGNIKLNFMERNWIGTRNKIVYNAPLIGCSGSADPVRCRTLPRPVWASSDSFMDRRLGDPLPKHSSINEQSLLLSIIMPIADPLIKPKAILGNCTLPICFQNHLNVMNTAL